MIFSFILFKRIKYLMIVSYIWSMDLVQFIVYLLIAFLAAGLAKFVVTALLKLVKVAIFTLAGFMILSQLDIASSIVNTAFVVTLSAIAVAFALAFGLGGKDFAKKTLDKVKNKENEDK